MACVDINLRFCNVKSGECGGWLAGQLTTQRFYECGNIIIAWDYGCSAVSSRDGLPEMASRITRGDNCWRCESGFTRACGLTLHGV